MYCCKRIALVGLLLLTAVGLAGTPEDDAASAISEIVAASRSALERGSESAAELAETFQGADNGVLKEGWDAPAALPLEGARSLSHSPQAQAWNQSMDALEGLPSQAIGQAPPRPKTPEDVVYVFFSLSMDDSSIRALFRQALAGETGRPVIFLLRGWRPPDIQGVVRELNGLFPEADAMDGLPNVQINPTLFRQAEVEVVPSYVTRDSQGVWRKLVGEVSLKEAVDIIRDGRLQARNYGPVFAIEEPDILTIMEQRMVAHDWDREVERARERVYEANRYGGNVPHATAPASYLVDLTRRLNRSLSGVDGAVFAPAGTEINPFDHITVRRRYLFFDGLSDSHVEVTKSWLRAHPTAMLITTQRLPDQARREKLLEQFRRPVHQADPMLIERFDIRAVPAMAFQEGRLLRVEIAPAH